MTHYIPKPIRHIMGVCAETFDITPEQLLSKRRVRTYAYPRQIAMCLARQLTPFSFTQLGYFFKRDHTTVVYAVYKISTHHLRDLNRVKEQLGKHFFEKNSENV